MQPNMPKIHGLLVYRAKGTVRRYVDDFCRKLLHVNNAAPVEVLDRFVRGLSAPVHAQVLVADP